MRFWSSSLLFVDHEDEDQNEGEDDARNADAAGGDDETPGSPPLPPPPPPALHQETGARHPAADVRMIDFAHVELQEGNGGGGEGDALAARAGDENYMHGLASLLEHLRRLRARAAAVEAGHGGS